MCFFLVICLFGLSAAAQSVLQSNDGRIEGLTFDSATKAPLVPVTISIYASKSMRLIRFQFNDERGVFKISGLPLDSALTVKASYVGFHTLSRDFVLTKNNRNISGINFGLSQASSELEEVKITSPMVLRGDTLEFNIDAFKSKPNAVIGDVIRNLPGVVMWSDGKITVNGKAVNKFLVNGKVFFSGDSRIATENLPKDIVDKVQIIKEKGNNMADSTQSLTMNIALKKNMDKGLFGKLAGDLGTTKRRELNLMIAGFTPKSQLSIVGNTNNINKSIDNMEEMMINGAFKPIGLSNSGEPGFKKSGISEQHTTGIIYNYTPNNKVQFTSDYQLSKNLYNLQQDNQSIIFLNDSTNSRTQALTEFSNQLRNITNLGLKLTNGDIDQFESKFHIGMVDGKEIRNEQGLLSSSISGAISNNIYYNNESFKRSNNSVTVKWNHNAEALRKGKSIESFMAEYNFGYDFDRTERSYQNSFKSVDGSITANTYDRGSQHKQKTGIHEFKFNYLDLDRLLGIRRSLFQAKLINYLEIRNAQKTAKVDDYNVSSPTGITNNFLSYQQNDLAQIMEKPGIMFTKNFNVSYANQYAKNLSISFFAQGIFINQNNRSERDPLNVNRRYNNFTPSIHINYDRLNFRSNRHQFDIGYDTFLEIPDVNQLISLVDSAQYLLYFGNSRLQSSYKHEFKLQYNWSNTNKNIRSAMVLIQGGLVDRFISDSTAFNSSGQREITPVNVRGYRYFLIKSNYLSAIRINNNNVQLSLYANLDERFRPYFTSGQSLTFKSLYISTGGNISVSLGALWNATLSESINIYTAGILNSSSMFRNTFNSNQLKISLNYPHNFIINSYIDSYLSWQSATPMQNVILLNLSANYRLGKRDQFEIRIGANDILRQNKAIFSTFSDNSFIFSRDNRLQQYFSLGLSYFPRKFSK